MASETVKPKIEVTRNVKLNLKADDWQLYDKRGRETVASEMNKQLERLIRNHTTREAVANLFDKAQAANADYGASDTEAYAMVERILDIAYADTGA